MQAPFDLTGGVLIGINSEPGRSSSRAAAPIQLGNAERPSRIRSDNHPIDVTVDSGAVLDGVGEIIGSLVIDGGSVPGVISSRDASFPNDSTVNGITAENAALGPRRQSHERRCVRGVRSAVPAESCINGGTVNISGSLEGMGGTEEGDVTVGNLH